MTFADPIFDPQGHLLDLALEDAGRGGADPTASEHLKGCLLCRVRLRRLQATPSVVDDFDALAHRLPPSPPVPRAVLDALNRPGTDALPMPGEIWLTIDAGVRMVWVRKVLDEIALVQPVVFDVEMADDYTLIVPAGANPLGVPLAVFCSVDGQADLDRLERQLCTLDAGDAVESLRSARRSGTTAPDLTVGPPIEDPSDERLEFRQDLTDQLAELSLPADIGENETTCFIRDRLEDLRSRRPYCRYTACDEVLIAMADAAGWRAVGAIRELDVIVVLVLAPASGAASPAARELLDTADATAVAFIEDNDDFETRVFTANELAAERIIAPTGDRIGVDVNVPALGLVDALFKHLDAEVQPVEFDEDLPVEADQVDDISDIVHSEAVDAVAVGRARRYQRLKGEAFKALSDDDAAAIEAAITTAADGGPSVLAGLRAYNRSR